jgi:hypothetical protein
VNTWNSSATTPASSAKRVCGILKVEAGEYRRVERSGLNTRVEEGTWRSSTTTIVPVAPNLAKCAAHSGFSTLPSAATAVHDTTDTHNTAHNALVTSVRPFACCTHARARRRARLRTLNTRSTRVTLPCTSLTRTRTVARGSDCGTSGIRRCRHRPAARSASSRTGLSTGYGEVGRHRE